ncbi:MAG TPA: hypothetical protein VK446_09315 [Methylocystis sp.]|nr:hypothetical protein [Methylocystis sp.]
MASVYRAASGEFLGYMTDLHGPVCPSITHWTFRAWRHASGDLRAWPEHSSRSYGDVGNLPFRVRIPIRNSERRDLQLLVPEELLDFILTHPSFRAAAPAADAA